ncbi:Asp-tRNA(Asn)/Glu-tRNA(Gln) amidotransferase subunit GatB [Lujinxingia litoralis]|nr:Asp-tRNA(Asn)/Glu-tRNA(Gln) amidotransferase subunit GatB [Lujinxingia litoralis]
MTTYDTTRWQADIGLEIHCQLLTRTRLFSAGPLPARTDQAPNSLLTPYDLGLPGTLPRLNDQAVDLAIRAGIALGCELQPWSRFDRKHYLYPDLPKGYQLTQQSHPICRGGALPFTRQDGSPARLPLERIHLEEDAGRSLHERLPDHTLVDLNRAGTPLIEIVTAPALHCPLDVERALRTLHRLLVWLEIGDGNLQEGSMRFDANVSVRPAGDPAPGVRCELKNLNSFRFVREALTLEIDRHIDALQAGTPLTPQTRAYDPRRGQTFALRAKEASVDYRYLPDPDLPPLHLTPKRIAELRAAHPEHPDAREQRLARTLELSADLASTICDSPSRADFFEDALAQRPPELPDERLPAFATILANLLVQSLLACLAPERGLSRVRDLQITPAQLTSIAALQLHQTLSATGADTLAKEVAATGHDPFAVVERLGLRQCRDPEALRALVDRVLASHPDQVQAYRDGKTKLLGFFVGQAMNAAPQKPDPQLLTTILRERLHD